jgi:hypothetical protein
MLLSAVGLLAAGLQLCSLASCFPCFRLMASLTQRSRRLRRTRYVDALLTSRYRRLVGAVLFMVYKYHLHGTPTRGLLITGRTKCSLMASLVLL